MKFTKFSDKLPPFHVPFILYRETYRTRNSRGDGKSGYVDFMYLSRAPAAKDETSPPKARGVTLNWVDDGDVSEPHFTGETGWWAPIPVEATIPHVLYRERDKNGVIQPIWTNNPALCENWVVRKNEKYGNLEVIERKEN